MNNNETMKREYPERPIASMAACVFKDDKILIIRRANPPSQGMWSLPGGVVELGETIQETTRREVEEECGIEIEVGDVFHAANLIVPDEKGNIRFHYVVTYLLAYYKSGEARPDSDAMDIKWVKSEELTGFNMNPIVYENIMKAFRIASIKV
jgi:8-oxo-dGTP diphosphatase